MNIWTDNAFPFMLIDLIEETDAEIRERVDKYIDSRPIFRFSDKLTSLMAADPVIELYTIGAIFHGMTMRGWIPSYDQILFFKEQYPDYDYRNGVVKERKQQALIAEAYLKHKKEALSVKDMFNLSAEEEKELARELAGKPDERGGEDLQSKESDQ